MHDQHDTRITLPTTLTIAALPAVTAVLAPFASLYFINVANLAFPWQAHLRAVALAVAAVFSAGLAFQLAAPRRLRPAAAALVLALGAWAWAEGTLLVGHFGALQGHAVAWSDHAWLLGGEAALLAIFAWLWLRCRGAVLRRAPIVVAVLILSSAASLYPAYVDHQSQIRTPPRGAFSRAGVFDLSPERNVIVIVLDTFQADVFAQALADHPDRRAALDGFTWFPDAVSGFPKTYASMAQVMTGRAFGNAQPFTRYQREAYRGDSLPAELRRAGFDARILAAYPRPYVADPDVVDNVARDDAPAERDALVRRDLATLADLVLFRIAPFALKPWLFNDGRFRLGQGGLPSDGRLPYALKAGDRRFSADQRTDDLEFLDRALAFLNAGSDRPTLRIWHLEGVHEPLMLDPELQPVPRRPATRAATLDQAAAMLRLLALVFARMDELGVYDNSTIVVMGDHGAVGLPDVGYDAGILAAAVGEAAPPPAGDDELAALLRGGTPLLLVKPAGRRGDLSVSAAPVALADIRPTVFADLGLAVPDGAVSVFAVPADSVRTRHHRFYRHAQWEADYIVPLLEYTVTGRVWDPAAWRLPPRELAPDLGGRAGTLIVLGDEGNLDDFAHAGWSAADGDRRRPVAPIARVTAPLPAGEGDVPVVVIVAVEPGEGPVPSVDLQAAGVELGQWVDLHLGENRLEAVLPAEACAGRGAIELGIACPEGRERLGVVSLRLAPR